LTKTKKNGFSFGLGREVKY